MQVISERFATVLLLLFMLLNTAACGNKGALYIPDAKPVAQQMPGLEIELTENLAGTLLSFSTK